MKVPSGTPEDTRHAKALVRTVAAALRQHGAPSLETVDMARLEGQPQILWPLLDAAVAAGTARRRDEAQVAACRWLVANQLELIRYRVERGHDWAQAMLDEYQQRLIGLARAGSLPGSDWFSLVTLLQDAKIPIRPEIAEALAQAVADATPAKHPRRSRSRTSSGILDELGRLADDPFTVVEGLAETGALMPAELRAYLTHELGLSPNAVLREAGTLLLLDPEPAVRQAAAAVLEQVAAPEAVSPVMLRRTLLARNWAPEAEREAIDRFVRKARLKGVACAQWPVGPAVALQGSMVDGSGAQSVFLTSPTGRTGLFAGLLLKLGFGVRDAWCDPATPRREISRALKEIQRQTASHAVGRDYLDTVVQHAIAQGLSAGNLPRSVVIAIAEAVGAADWKDRGLDVAAETGRLFDEMDAELRNPVTIAASLQRSGAWVAYDPEMQSWFEDDAAIRALIEGRPRLKPEVVVRRVLEKVLPVRRAAWAERLLLQALWLQAGAGDEPPPSDGRTAWCWGTNC